MNLNCFPLLHGFSFLTCKVRISTCFSLSVVAWMASSFPRATWTNYHKVGGREHLELLLSQIWRPKSKITASARPCSLLQARAESFLPPFPLQRGLPWLWPHNFNPHLCVPSHGLPLRVLSSSYKDDSHWIRITLKPLSYHFKTLNQLYLQGPYFKIRSQLEVLDGQWIWGGYFSTHHRRHQCRSNVWCIVSA